MTKHPLRAAAVVFALHAVALPSNALADDEQLRRQVFEQARAAMQAGQWEDARAFYQQLWNERHTYDVALQLGLSEYNLKRMRDAAEHLAYGLMLLPPREKAQTAERSEQILGLCKQAVGAVDLRVKNKGADVIVDGKLVATSPLVTEVFVDPGEHRFEVRLDGHTSEAFTIQIDAGQSKSRTVELKPLVSQPIAPKMHDGKGPVTSRTAAGSPRTWAPTVEPSTTHASWTPILVGGLITVVGMSAGIGFQLVRDAREDESNRIRGSIGRNACANPKESAIDSCNRLSEVATDYDRYGRLELAGFILGGLALVSTGTYFFVARPDRAKPVRTALWGPIQLSTDLTTHAGLVRVTADF